MSAFLRRALEFEDHLPLCRAAQQCTCPGGTAPDSDTINNRKSQLISPLAQQVRVAPIEGEQLISHIKAVGLLNIIC
jgi:hypothetical protein